MPTGIFTLKQILEVTKVHPFYTSRVQYPPNEKILHAIRDEASPETGTPALPLQPLLHKKTLYREIARLMQDLSPENTYRRSSYLSSTGGGSGGLPMMFAVDGHENRRQRMQTGRLLQLTRVVDPADWVLSLHTSGKFYRSLDLITEIMENAGATLLSAGNYMSPAKVTEALAHYHVNVLTGDPSQIIQVVRHISSLTPAARSNIQLTKIIYTSESLTGPQIAFIRTVLGDVQICSVIGSAEAGPWAVGNPALTGRGSLTDTSMDFVFDTRNVIIEILPLTALDEGCPASALHPLPLGESGIIVQTSLQRLRNPLVRYITGDVGSLHPLPASASSIIPEAERAYLQVLRLTGRDRRFSFDWYGNYLEFDTMKSLMQADECGILHWQVVLGQPNSPVTTLEVRVLRAPPRVGILSDEQFTKRLHTFFDVSSENEALFKLVFLKDVDGFERSSTGRKIVNFIDRVH
ncbi:hypothetical protein P175DRAFT_0496082 [Aspergillus ochraceoroseus IBT 24754]|uniref:AMP-dependent synthetase/ligase domain-containing protein n=1 Tax=Aspergillus ochraceoroseus IBT 24754 TaxID=1392256 RepID=A0A2T5LNR9_9EURO|nr:uncharacterized protein P175DRAFT_0496082 [Aspergillus ochraceoroseus IBT 24754]PTU17922.1 hypothetical protein P175DRAFT_0496082 [Aspergillus ochraceoroseus IBT 24754]